MDAPELTIVGGPNGSGKSTFAIAHTDNLGIPYVGADSIAAELNPDNPFSVRIAASRLFVESITASLRRKESFVVETTLAGRSFRHHIQAARENGFQITILFVFLDSADTCVERVAQRVLLGGHDVSEADIRRRFTRSIANFWNTYREMADSWILVYNSADTPATVAIGDSDRTIIRNEKLFETFKLTVDNA